MSKFIGLRFSFYLDNNIFTFFPEYLNRLTSIIQD